MTEGGNPFGFCVNLFRSDSIRFRARALIVGAGHKIY